MAPSRMAAPTATHIHQQRWRRMLSAFTRTLPRSRCRFHCRNSITNVPASPHRRPLVTFTSAEKKQLFAFKERFLYNEKEQLAVRNIKFNPDAAQRVACSVVGGNCTSFEVLTDGGYNRVFVLGFDNGQEVVLRIPWSPLAGPPHAMTASEVATMEFMREVLDVPVPRVLAWSANAQTSPIGSEFILMEPVAGQPFESQYLEICTENTGQFGAMMRHFVEIQARCAELAFSQIGSLYFKEDVSRELQDRPLFSESANMDDKLRKASERYRIGPLTDRQWWRCERQSMDLDRGPWPDVVSYFRAAALSEISFINSPYALRSSFRKAPLETREEHLKLLNDCLTLIPYIVPPAEFCAPTIWFPDASGTNIMTDSNFKITGLIDWQQAVIAPYFTQHMEFPSAFKYTEGLLPIPSVGYGILPSNIDEFDPEFQKLLHLHRQKVTRHRAYEIAIAKVEPKREKFSAFSRAITSWVSFPHLALRSWSDGAMRLKFVIAVTKRYWSDISKDPFPIQVTSDEEKRWLEGYILAGEYVDHCEGLQESLEVQADGLVSDAQSYEDAKLRLADAEKIWVDEVEGGPFPYKDGMWSGYLT